MTIEAINKLLGGATCTEIDRVFSIQLAASNKFYVDRLENFSLDLTNNLLEFDDSSSKMHYAIDTNDIDIVVFKTDKSEDNYRKQIM